MRSKKIINSLLVISMVFFAGQSVCAAPVIQHSGRASPDVSFEKVQEIFGFNLDTNDTLLKTLLLAIAMDHTSSRSPNMGMSIGIPFIVDRGPNYWVDRLEKGESEIEVLVNNAIILLFTKEAIKNSKDAAIQLLRIASDKGHWPADFFTAEVNLEKYLSVDYGMQTPLTGHINASLSDLAKSTMEKYNRCAEIGFAPCQYRIGFWLLNSPKNSASGIKVLQHAINTTIADTRYQGVMDRTVVLAAKEIVMKGPSNGLGALTLNKYRELLNMYEAKSPN
jgi:hypothetical protein